MGKIYYGQRGSGKTTKLLKQAEAIQDEGFIPVIVCVIKDYAEMLKNEALKQNIDTHNFVFLSFSEAKDLKNRRYFEEECYRIFIDELTCFIRDILGIRNNNSSFYATLSSEDCKEIKRTW